MREVPLYEEETREKSAHLAKLTRFCKLMREGMQYRGTSLESKRTPLGPYSRAMSRALGGSSGDGRFRMGQVPLYFPGVRVERGLHQFQHGRRVCTPIGAVSEHGLKKGDVHSPRCLYG